MKKVWRLILSLSMIITGFSSVSHAQDSSNRKLEGWQKAKFGMTLQQVKAIYPDAELQVELAKSCKSKARDLLSARPKDEDYTFYEEQFKREWSYPNIPNAPTHDCSYLVLNSQEIGGREFRVAFYFSVATRMLEYIKLRNSEADLMIYNYLKEVLQAKYGRGEETKTTAAEVQEACTALSARLRRGDQVTGAQIAANTKQVIMSILFRNGAVRLREATTVYCEGYADNSWAQETYDMFTRGDKGRMVAIEFESRPSVSQSDMNNF